MYVPVSQSHPIVAVPSARVQAQQIRGSTSTAVDVAMLALVGASLQRVQRMMSHLLHGIADELELKMSAIWDSVPHRMLGAFGQVFGEDKASRGEGGGATLTGA